MVGAAWMVGAAFWRCLRGWGLGVGGWGLGIGDLGRRRWAPGRITLRRRSRRSCCPAINSPKGASGTLALAWGLGAK